jgi:hypothetical protein
VRVVLVIIRDSVQESLSVVVVRAEEVVNRSEASQCASDVGTPINFPTPRVRARHGNIHAFSTSPSIARAKKIASTHPKRKIFCDLTRGRWAR